MEWSGSKSIKFEGNNIQIYRHTLSPRKALSWPEVGLPPDSSRMRTNAQMFTYSDRSYSAPPSKWNVTEDKKITIGCHVHTWCFKIMFFLVTNLNITSSRLLEYFQWNHSKRSFWRTIIIYINVSQTDVCLWRYSYNSVLITRRLAPQIQHEPNSCSGVFFLNLWWWSWWRR